MKATRPTVEARAPGKLILSGEHAVVYGRPALVTAVDLYATCKALPRNDAGVTFHLPDLGISQAYSPEELASTRDRLVGAYATFLKGDLPIEELLQDDTEALAYTVASFLAQSTLPLTGLELEMTTNLPVGCGMGSSAAVTQSLLQALAGFLGADLEAQAFYDLALDTEKLQHGRPSGVDPFVTLHGGFVRFRSGRAEKTLESPGRSFAMVHTGTPESTTGECVMQVAQFSDDEGLWNAFEEVATTLERAFRDEDTEALREAVQENHQLLRRIGVVPAAVHEWITCCESEGTAAKICGAGAVRGHAGGMVWVLDGEVAESLSGRGGFKDLAVHSEPEGAKLLP